MFFISRPRDEQIKAFLDAAARQEFSYDSVGLTRELQHPHRCAVDHNRQLLGSGKATFDRAVNAIESWKMFDFPWIQLVHDSPPCQDVIVCVQASHLGFYSLNACKVIYVIDERGDATSTSGSTTTFGFAYGTLADHAESGEERFCVEWNSEDDSVHYDLFSFSKPGKFITLLGYPIARHYQHRFIKYSKAAMLRAVN